MPRWSETWLTGLASAAMSTEEPGAWRGQRLGLPQSGPGSLASTGARVGAFAIDALACGLIAALFIPDAYDARRGVLGMAIIAIEYIVLLSLTGQTFGMRLVGLRVVPIGSDAGTPRLLGTLLRTALLVLLLPALIFDRERRGLHDRAGGTVVVSSR